MTKPSATLLLLLLPFLAIPTISRANMEPSPTSANGYWGASDSSNYTGSLDYVFSIPTMGTHDFTPSVSFLGVAIESFRKTSEKFGLGFSFSWIYFKDEQTGTFPVQGATVTGTRFSAIDAFPFLLMGRVIPTSKKQLTPFIGGGLGPMWGMRRGNIGVFGLDNTGWQFALAGELGVTIQRAEGVGGLRLAARYTGGFGSDAIPAISYISLHIGIIGAF
jgi:hypothetical protein